MECNIVGFVQFNGACPLYLSLDRSRYGRRPFLVGSDHLVFDKGPLEEVRRTLRSGLTEMWMNVVLDLNGLLYVTEDSKSKGPSKEYNHCPSHVLSGMAPR